MNHHDDQHGFRASLSFQRFLTADFTITMESVCRKTKCINLKAKKIIATNLDNPKWEKYG